MKVLTRICALAGLAAGFGALTPRRWPPTSRSASSPRCRGRVSSLGIPYEKGIKAAVAYKSELNGRKIQLVQLDDASDPSTAARNARKLIDEDKVDVIIGPPARPTRWPIAVVARDQDAADPRSPDAEPAGTTEGAGWSRCRRPAPLMVRRWSSTWRSGREDGRLHRLLRRLGRPGLRRASSRAPSRPASRSCRTSAMRAPTSR